ncbi:WS/DGAT/MGAT family O-acyltransferase [Nocardia sp. CA-135398]|uniref:WS/DGAT/MGAT family O-acyltransferase n=1 Tax=Nocardia sp. CA-135398 TaxID=3239977 RepID=UPI003D961071
MTITDQTHLDDLACHEPGAARSTAPGASQLGVRITTPGEQYAASPDRMATIAPDVTIPLSNEYRTPRQLSSLDLQLLDGESPSTPLHVGAITLLEPAAEPLTVTAVRRLIADRLPMLAPLRWRLRTVPLGLDLPYWEDCAQIDLGYHVRETRLPHQATEVQLAELVSRMHAIPLDRTRPLWECRLISGLPDGRQALYTKVHHAVIDGVSAAEIMAALLDVTAEPHSVPVPADGVRLHRTPGTAEMLVRSVPNALTRQSDRVRSSMHMGPTLLRALADIGKKHPAVPFNGPTTANRSFAYTSLSLDEVKVVKNSFGGTVNDVVMTLCTSALRRWLIEHDAPADRPLLAAVPASVRTAEQLGTAGNQFSIMLCELPIDEPEPQHRMKLLHSNLLEVKQRFRSNSPTVLHEATSMIPPLLHGLATRTLLRVSASALPLANVIISNVAGPQFPLYAAGSRVSASYPVSVLTELSGGLNITVMSYDGHLDFGILACPDAVPDVWDIADYLRDALAELLD